MNHAATELEAISFPDHGAKERYESLVGIQSIQRDLLTAISVAVRPAILESWSRRNPGVDAAVQLMLRRPALFILAGDVGSGKTELGETIGDALARREDIDVLLYRLSLSARGTGLVGEMTQRLTGAFAQVIDQAKRWKGGGTAGILFIDEADAIAQSRETIQMHHEDRAGVNALIRAVDEIGRARVPVAVVMATNRLDSLDPAIRRRAANTFEFSRPVDEQRAELFRRIIPKIADDSAELKRLVQVTGPLSGLSYGFSYSDIVQRLIPDAVLIAFREGQPLTLRHVIETATMLKPTPPFLT